MKNLRLLMMVFVLVMSASLLAQDNAAKEKFNAGVTARNAKNFVEAEKQFVAATAGYAQYKEAWKELGAVRCDLKKWALAEEAFQKAIAIDANYQAALYGLGRAQIQSKKYALAEANLKKALDLKPGDPDTQKGLGLLYFEQKMWDKSIEYYEGYNAGNSSDAKSHYFLAKAYKEKGDNAKAEKEFQASTRIDPKFAEAFLAYANMLEKDKRYTAAVSAYKSAVANDRGMVTAYYGIAIAYMKAEMYPEALQGYKDFVKVAEGKAAWKGEVDKAKTQYIPQLEEAISGGQ
jgi:tetratricopeptide (TPR) repeat protein